jgi:S-DNA-T family DNA segregation ATPase FtsK/SpoIIIE
MVSFGYFLTATVMVSTMAILGKAKKTSDKDQEALNEFFKLTGFCNKKEQPEYARVKWVNDYENYKIFDINIPVGCDINILLRMKYALENLFENDVEILYDNQNYRVKVFKGKLKKAQDYPFTPIAIPDRNHLYITPAVSLSGPMTINLSSTLPNILLAGTSGSGKSTLVKSIICQLLENYEPHEFNLMYMDNKGGVESNLFKNIKHLTVRTKNPGETIDALIDLKQEMFARMELLEKQNVTSIVDYNKAVSDENKLPFVLAVIDELFSFSTLPTSSNNPNDTHTQKVAYRTMGEIASMCRAAGIHLMFCTQKPTSDVIPTYITCNCGIRIGLRTSNEQESRNIIEENGLELISNEDIGAGIVKTGGMTRIQSFWLTDYKVKEICKKHRGEPKKAVKIGILEEGAKEEIKKQNLDWREIARGM